MKETHTANIHDPRHEYYAEHGHAYPEATSTNVVATSDRLANQAQATQCHAEEERQPTVEEGTPPQDQTSLNTDLPSKQHNLSAELFPLNPGPVQLHLVLALRPHVYLDEDQLILHLRGTRTGLFGTIPPNLHHLTDAPSAGSSSGLWSKDTEAFFGQPRPEVPVYIPLTDLTESDCGSSNLGSYLTA